MSKFPKRATTQIILYDFLRNFHCITNMSFHYQLTKFQVSSLNTFRDILPTKLQCQFFKGNNLSNSCDFVFLFFTR